MDLNSDTPLTPDEQIAYIRGELAINQYLTNPDTGETMLDGDDNPVPNPLWDAVATKWRLHLGKGDSAPYLRMLYTFRDTIMALKREARLFVDNKIGNDQVSASQVLRNADSLLSDVQNQIVEVEGPQNDEAGIMGSVNPRSNRTLVSGRGGRFSWRGAGGKGW